jgi:hypothetical protein
MGTHWKLERNMLGTREKWKKSFPPTPSLTNFCFREMVSLGGATIFFASVKWHLGDCQLIGFPLQKQTI